MYQVRFHLGAGDNYRKWQVRGPDGVRYYDPDSTSLVLRGCVLKNRRSVAEKVNKTQKRDVCGHVRCESVEAVPAISGRSGRVVHFDPKLAPHWTVEGSQGSQDGLHIETLVSSGRRLYESESDGGVYARDYNRDNSFNESADPSAVVTGG